MLAGDLVHDLQANLGVLFVQVGTVDSTHPQVAFEQSLLSLVEQVFVGLELKQELVVLLVGPAEALVEGQLLLELARTKGAEHVEVTE